MSVIQDVIDKVGDALKKAVDDITELSVVTTTGYVYSRELDREDPEDSNKKLTIPDIKSDDICAKTLIQIDGDVITQIPVKKVNGEPVQIDERMLELHQENVALAMENWQTVVTTLGNLVQTLTGLGKPDEK